MMVLFLDVNNNVIVLYGKEGVTKIPFHQAGQLYDYIEENNVLYITNAMQTNANDVVNLIKGMGIDVGEDIPDDTGLKYLHSPAEGTIYINEFLRFDGRFDIKLIDEQLAQVIKTSPLLQQLIKNKKVNIVGEGQRRRLIGEKKIYQQKILDRQGRIEQGYSDMIVQTTVETVLENGIVDDGHDSAVEINILGAGSVSDAGGAATMSELMGEIDSL